MYLSNITAIISSPTVSTNDHEEKGYLGRNMFAYILIHDIDLSRNSDLIGIKIVNRHMAWSTGIC